MLLWSRKTSVIFVPHTTQPDFVRIVWGRRCCSMQGRQGGQQTLQMGKRCNSQSSLVHHLGHVAGLAIHGPELDRSLQEQNHLPSSPVDDFQQRVQQQANPLSSVMLLKYHVMSSKKQRNLGLAKLQPGRFDVLNMNRLYPTNPCGGRRSAKAQDFNGGAGSQEITSPDFPAWYWADTDCAWQVDSPANQRVVLQRQYVSLEHSDDCQFDYIEVADIGAGNATRFCGRDFPETLISSSRFGFIVRFHSDSGEQENGFQISYRSIEDSCQSHQQYCSYGCTQLLGGPVCNCPDGQKLWRDNKTCVADERCATPDGICEHGCRLEADGFATCSCMAGTFLSEDGITCQSCVHNITIGEPGEFASPNFPGNYPRNTECIWQFRSADPAKQVAVTFDTLHMEPGRGDYCPKDYLEVFFHPDEHSSAEVWRLCGQYTQTPLTITSNTDYMKLRLFSDATHEYPGVSFSYAVSSPPAEQSDEDIADQNLS
ncbi:tolloid-like protein 1 isoform X2 [Sycon ciliatum]